MSEIILEKQQNIVRKNEELIKMQLATESLKRNASEDLKIINELKNEFNEKNSNFINIIQLKQLEVVELKNLVKKLQLDTSESKPVNTGNVWM
jgi:ribosome biogenesis protein Nip4